MKLKLLQCLLFQDVASDIDFILNKSLRKPWHAYIPVYVLSLLSIEYALATASHGCILRAHMSEHTLLNNVMICKRTRGDCFVALCFYMRRLMLHVPMYPHVVCHVPWVHPKSQPIRMFKFFVLCIDYVGTDQPSPILLCTTFTNWSLNLFIYAYTW